MDSIFGMLAGFALTILAFGIAISLVDNGFPDITINKYYKE